VVRHAGTPPAECRTGVRPAGDAEATVDRARAEGRRVVLTSAVREPEAADARDLSEWDDARLVRACIDGDDDAWTAIIGRYRRLIFSIPLRYGAKPEDAADVFQAVCLEMFSELPKLRKVESLRAWLITMTAHKSFHWKRRTVRRHTHEAEELDPEIAGTVPPVAQEVLEAADREQLLRDSVTRLPARCREMVRLLFFEQIPLPYKAVGQRLGVATGSIGFIRGRCLKKLQRDLENAGFTA
jgi:RNA polymerase sigma factor (sigma-70 family)